MRENEENECIKLAVIPDVIHSRILFNMYIKIKVLKEGKKPPFIDKRTISATQLGALEWDIVDYEAYSMGAAIHGVAVLF